MTDLEEVGRTIAAAEPFQILLNNAGTNRPKPFDKVSVDDFDFIMNLNVRSAFFMAQAIAKRLIETGLAGSIINMSSQMGHVGGVNRSVYCASKWAMEGFSRSMALDLAQYRIRVNTVAPTFIETPLSKPFLDDPDIRKWILDRIPLGRVGTVEEVAAAVVFLASPAAALVTGSSLLVDGGWTAW